MTTDKTPMEALPPGSRRQIIAYMGILMLLMALCDPNSGLMDIPVSFLLKNIIHMNALEVSQFRLVVSTPLFLSFVFGLIRDGWSPFGLGDRGHLLAFGALSVVTYAAFAFIHASPFALFISLLLLTVWSLFIASAQNGLAATLGQQHAMTGQMSTVWNLFTALPAVLAFLIGGQLSDLLKNLDAQTATQSIFLTGAVTSLALVAFALVRPAAVYDNVTREHREAVQPLSDLKRLMADRLARRALLIWTLWNLAPGSATPLQFYIQDVLGGTTGQWGQWNALYTASFIPTFLLFGALCSRVAFQDLLKWGTLIAIPQFVPLLLVGSLGMAIFVAIPIGLMGGLASAAYVALVMRAAPPGLQGTMMMSASSAYFVATRFGDVFASALYDWFGDFTLCVALCTAIYASIFFLLPRSP
jgi:Na+/melibiose symporter-like transporter